MSHKLFAGFTHDAHTSKHSHLSIEKPKNTNTNANMMNNDENF